jgi:hypothetical protein
MRCFALARAHPRESNPGHDHNAIVRGARDVVCFQGQDLAHPLLVLGQWSAVALSVRARSLVSVTLGVIAAGDLRHLSERRYAPREGH